MIGLFPGGFKCFTDAHMEIVQRCLKLKDISKLHIIISNKDRDGITAESSFDFIYSLFKNNKRVEVSISEDPSPIKTCYSIVGNASHGTFALISSDKGNDYERVEQFVEAFSEKGPYYNKRVNVILCPIKIDPVTYKNRSDRYNNTAVSATVARNDIRKNDYENFKTNYEHIIEDYGIPEGKIKTYFNNLRNEMLLDTVSEQAIFRNLQSNDRNSIEYKALCEAFDFDDDSVDKDIESTRENIKDTIRYNKLSQMIKAYAADASGINRIYEAGKFHIIEMYFNSKDTLYLGALPCCQDFSLKSTDKYKEFIELILEQSLKEIFEYADQLDPSKTKKLNIDSKFSCFLIQDNENSPRSFLSNIKKKEIAMLFVNFWKQIGTRFDISNSDKFAKDNYQYLVFKDIFRTNSKVFFVKDFVNAALK
jgi:hypothetical protein